MACPERPAEGAAARSLGPTITRPQAGRPCPENAWVLPFSGKFSFLMSVIHLAPHLGPGPAFPEHSYPSYMLLSYIPSWAFKASEISILVPSPSLRGKNSDSIPLKKTGICKSNLTLSPFVSPL